MAYDYRLLADGFAAEIEGVDLSRPLSDAQFDSIRAIWMDNKVAVIRDQSLTDADLLRFSQRFGTLFVHVRSQFHSRAHPEVMLISNAREDGRNLGALGDGELAWHSDQAYTERPVFGTLLYGIAIPSHGGATQFCDLARAYADMPEPLRRRIHGLRVNYAIEVTVGNLELPEAQRRAMPARVSHPLVRTHPHLGRRSLYLSPDHVERIAGLPTAESDALLRDLVDWATRPPRIYAHVWRPGDVVLWDNIQVMHRRTDFPRDEVRTLKRTGFHLPEAIAVPV